MTLRIGALASHGGSNLQAIIDACASGRLDAEVVVVISNNSGAPALQRAAAAGIPTAHLSSRTHPDAEELDQAVLGSLRDHGTEIVVLAGYMKRLGPRTTDAFRGRVLNIHPALLPRHGGVGMFGERVHAAVLAAGDTESGATVHVVDEQYDEGPILAQARVPVLPDDDVSALARRVLVAEHRLYVETLQKVADGRIILPTTGND